MSSNPAVKHGGRISCQTPDPALLHLVVFLLFLSYLGYYLGRTNLAIVLPELIRQQRISYGLGGLISTVSHMMYALAQPINGGLVDRFGAKRVLLVGLLGTVACNVLFGFVHYAPMMVVLWGINGAFQACGWPAVVKLASWWLPRETRGKYMSLVTISTNAGTLLTWFIAAALITKFDWRFAFWGPAPVMALVLLIVAYLMPVRAVSAATEAAPQPQTRPSAMVGILGLLRVAEIRLAALVLALVNLILNSVLLWAPTYLSNAGSSLGKTNWHVLGYPVVGAIGILVAGRVFDRYASNRQFRLLVQILIGLSGMLMAFGFTTPNSAFNLAALAGIGLCVTAANFVITGPVSLQVGNAQSRAATAGVIDGVGYVGSACGTLVTGWLVQFAGWRPVLLFWVVAAALAAVLAARLAGQMKQSERNATAA